jgi:SRSO17 transposase
LASESLGSYLLGFSKCFRAWRHDTSRYAEQMIKGYLLLERDRTYANIDRKINGMSHKNGQNLQHFMSDSPWESAPIFSKVQGDVCQLEGMSGGSLNFDEFGDECAGAQKAGAARQYIGRLGKTELGQVVVVGSYYQNGCWVLVDAEPFVPQGWFGEEKKQAWARLHIPPDTEFKTKIALAKEQFRRALKRGLLFRVVGCDSL